MLEYGFHALREEEKARHIAFHNSLLQSEKSQEQSQQQKQQQSQQAQQVQQAQQAQQAQEEEYYAQQQHELSSQAGRKGGSGKISPPSSTSDCGSAMLPPTPAKKLYNEYNSKKNTGTNFSRMKKKNSHDLQ